MNADMALGLISELLQAAAVLCLPLLAVILIVGLAVSVLQVVTQVQDASIGFVPKLMLCGVTLLLLAPWMLNRLTGFGAAMFARIAQ